LHNNKYISIFNFICILVNNGEFYFVQYRYWLTFWCVYKQVLIVIGFSCFWVVFMYKLDEKNVFGLLDG